MASTAMTFPALRAALFNWRNATHDFGRISQNKPGVEYTKEAILPGQSGTVKATFNAAALGAFNKSVMVESNAEGGTAVLYFKGEVVKEGAAAQ